MKLIVLIFTLFLSFQSAVMAHGGDSHDGTISEGKAFNIATQVAMDLSKRDVGLPFGQLPKTWERIWQKNVAIHGEGEGYLIVSVYNDEEDKTLYVLMSDKGRVYDANFEGVFKGVNDGSAPSHEHHDEHDHDHDHHKHDDHHGHDH